MSYTPGEPYFEGEYEIDNQGRIVWTFGYWEPVPGDEKRRQFVRSRMWPTRSGHKVKGRRRSSRDSIYITPAGVAR